MEKRLQFSFLRFSLGEIEQAMKDMTGFCIKCGEESDSVEPDSRGYECDSCGSATVYGAEELVIMGLVD